jgi:hypothetical protein
MLGRGDAAFAALNDLSDLYELLPSSVTSDRGLFCWPEHAFWHATSYVHTHLGSTGPALEAQAHALALYPTSSARSRVMIRLHRSRCLIIDGDIGTGLAEATNALDSLPLEYRGGPVGVLARGVMASLPANEHSRSSVDELVQRLRL